MDLCHCAQPAPKPTNGSLACTKCGMWYDEAEWRRDPRTTLARHAAAVAAQEQIDLVDRICGAPRSFSNWDRLLPKK